MLYEYDERWVPVPVEECDVSRELIGCLLLEQVEEHGERLGISRKTLELCMSNSLLYHKGMQSLDEYSFSILPLLHRESSFEERDKIGILVAKQMCLIIVISDSTHQVDRFFSEMISRKWEAGQVARFLYVFLDELLEKDAVILENMDFRIARMEEKLVREKPPKNFHNEIFSMKRELLLLRSYYEQLLEIGERLYGNDNKVLREKDREQFELFTQRVQRFRDNVMFLKEGLVEVREAYESYVDYTMNATMKFLTVSTTVFMPLTFMTGWYGMNFEYMPEIYKKAGYPLFCTAAILVAAVILIYFKKKRYL